jgi:hypothetical protein
MKINQKQFVVAFAIFVLGLSAFSAFSIFPTSAQKVERKSWEHCAITFASAPFPSQERVEKFVGTADICHFQNIGCRKEEVKIELNYGSFLQEIGSQENYQARQQASKRVREMAFGKAIAKLGDDGWEIVGDSIQNFDVTQTENYYVEKKAVYFKRLKQP